MAVKEFLTLKEAAEWATEHTGRRVAPHNIAYLMNYARIHKYDQEGKMRNTFNGTIRVSLSELREYYANNSREKKWKEILGNHINWKLSFDNVPEAETTKHVHRLHQYKGKFIPQLVEYFLDDHVNDFKDRIFFRKGDIILDPFVGSGTTLVECLELGLHSIGVDVSPFNCTISEAKTQKYDLDRATNVLLEAAKGTVEFAEHVAKNKDKAKLNQRISLINKTYFPNPQFKFMLGRLRGFRDTIDKEAKLLDTGDEIKPENIEKALFKHEDERAVIEEQTKLFTECLEMAVCFRITASNALNVDKEFENLYSARVLKLLPDQTLPIHAEQTELDSYYHNASEKLDFLHRWYTEKQRMEMQYYLTKIQKETDPKIRNLMRVILSRTVRSCRATTHFDLATLQDPQSEPYYCPKHYKICRPVTTIVNHLKRYTEDTIARLRVFEGLRQNVFCEVINGDSRTVDIFARLKERNPDFAKKLETEKIAGVFTSPPYVGQINYHEQHAYSYELFGIERKDDSEIGRKSRGTGKAAKADYINAISKVLINAKCFMKEDASIFVVANDKYNLYEDIAKKSGLRIEKTFDRPVLNRTERDKQPYSESIFLMKCG